MPNANARQMFMQDVRSLNIEPFLPVCPELVNMSIHAGHYAHSDPESNLVHLRNFAERLVDRVYDRLELGRGSISNFLDLLNNTGFRAITQPLVQDKLNLRRRLGNRCAHRQDIEAAVTLRCVPKAWRLTRWMHLSLRDGTVEDLAEFRRTAIEGIASKAEFKRKKKALVKEHTNTDEPLRQALEELAALRAAVGQRGLISSYDAPTVALKFQQMIEAFAEATNLLRFRDDNTRKRLIGRDLRMAGWDLKPDTVSSNYVGQEVKFLISQP
jgi:type I restriction enzyme R subunit